MPVFARICLIAAHACALAILAVPFAARWFFPVSPVTKPESFGAMLLLVVDAVSMAGRGAWSMAAVATLFGLVLLLTLVAWIGRRRAAGTFKGSLKCGIPILVAIVALVAAVALNDALPEVRS